MTSSEARRVLSLLSNAFGANGALLVRKGPGAEGADLTPGDALRWPKCLCNNLICPDYEPPTSPSEEFRKRVAERNRRSSRGGT